LALEDPPVEVKAVFRMLGELQGIEFKEDADWTELKQVKLKAVDGRKLTEQRLATY